MLFTRKEDGLFTSKPMISPTIKPHSHTPGSQRSTSGINKATKKTLMWDECVWFFRVSIPISKHQKAPSLQNNCMTITFSLALFGISWFLFAYKEDYKPLISTCVIRPERQTGWRRASYLPFVISRDWLYPHKARHLFISPSKFRLLLSNFTSLKLCGGR